MHHSIFHTIYFLVLIAVVCLGCNKNNGSSTAASAIKLKETPIDKINLAQERTDLNDDGLPDQIRYIKRGAVAKDGSKAPDVLMYITFDVNFDGVFDITEFYEEGAHIRDEIDLDYDGKIDLIVKYKEDRVVLKEYSTDFEQNRYGRQYYDENGNLSAIHRDTNLDGKFDTIEYYKPGETKPFKVENQVSQAE